MFCSEPILNVYTGHTDVYCEKTKRYDRYGDSFLDCYHDLAYHVEPGEILALETNSFAIFIDAQGVHLQEAPVKARSESERLKSCIRKEEGFADWVDLEQTLFEGEFLLSVRKEENTFLAEFTDFTLKIIPYEMGEMHAGYPRKDYRSYLPVLGVDRYIKRKCPNCGGDGEILLDFVSDYVVRCKHCKRATWAGMCLIDAIEDWNAGDLNCDASNITIE